MNSIWHFKQFYPVDNGYSMFTIDHTEKNIHLFRRGLNRRIFIGSIQDKINYLYSNSSNYLYLLDKSYRLYFYPMTENHNYHLKVIIEDVIKFRSNGKQCLAMDLEGDLLVWWMIIHQTEHFQIEFRPWKFQPFKEIFGKHTVILDFDCGHSNAVLLTCASDYQSQAIHVWRQSLTNENDDFLQTIHISYQLLFWNIIAGVDTFILMREGVLHVFESNAFNNEPMMITNIPKVDTCCNIPSTDIYVLITSLSWYVYNKQTGQTFRTLLRSLPDLYSFYGRYPSSPSFCRINRQNYLQEPYQIFSLQSFNNPYFHDFQIQIPMDKKTMRTIYALKSKLRQWKFYFNTLFQQHPNLNETSDLLLDIGYIEHFYYYKSIYTQRLPTFIVHDERILENIRILSAKHDNRPYSFHNV
ncbi:hypothetical protein BLA29_003290 [Euroglyphus maynei]|uniref:Uncharacterized protein n=1 Tax=Euroglyphus maynei TaxID=6958 RepID=A0A1Y3B2Q6_EURMA|nr:hypothetical protein BLA29_003290 [Euroglyphus maynei]